MFFVHDELEYLVMMPSFASFFSKPVPLGSSFRGDSEARGSQNRYGVVPYQKADTSFHLGTVENGELPQFQETKIHLSLISILQIFESAFTQSSIREEEGSRGSQVMDQ